MRKILAVLIVIAAIAFFRLYPEGASRGLTIVTPGERPHPEGEPSGGEARERELARPLSGPLLVRGLVIGADGNPQAGVAFAVRSGDRVAFAGRSARDGTFETEVEAEVLDAGASLEPQDASWIALAGPVHITPGLGEGYTLVVARSIEIRGRVVDEEGLPVAGADVAGSASASAPRALAVPDAPAFEQRARSGSDGRFSLGPLPATGWTRVRASREGYLPAETGAPLEEPPEVELILRRS
jgi:hypothetical protein